MGLIPIEAYLFHPWKTGASQRLSPYPCCISFAGVHVAKVWNTSTNGNACHLGQQVGNSTGKKFLLLLDGKLPLSPPTQCPPFISWTIQELASCFPLFHTPADIPIPPWSECFSRAQLSPQDCCTLPTGNRAEKGEGVPTPRWFSSGISKVCDFSTSSLEKLHVVSGNHKCAVTSRIQWGSLLSHIGS